MAPWDKAADRNRNTARASDKNRQAMKTAVKNRASGGGVRSQQQPRIRSNSSGSYAATPAPPSVPAGGGAVPDINGFLGGDAGYQDQLRQLSKTLNDFNADVGRRRGTLESEYGVSKKALGDQRVLDLDSIEDDYGARGLIRSGLYGKAVGDYETEYGNRVTDLDRRQQQTMNQLLGEESSFKSSYELQQQAAREAAIRRRAEQYGV